MTKIGDTLYHYRRENENRRGRDGEPMPLWCAEQIHGESKTHWRVGFEFNPNKVNKKTLFELGRRGFCGAQWFTEVGKIEREYQMKHARNISSMVIGANTDQLRQIAKIVGYKEIAK